MKKQILSILLVIAIFISIIPITSIEVNAVAAKTKEQAIAWINSRVNNTAKDMDGYYATQCVDFIQEYYSFLGVSGGGGNACQYATNTLPSGFTRIKDYYGFVPEPGDIAVWNLGWKGESYGHVGIVISADLNGLVVADVYGSESVEGINWNPSTGKTIYSSGKVHKTSYYPYSGGNHGCTFWGVIRPAYASSSTPTTGITLNKSNFSMLKGESVTLSATVTPSNATNKTATWSSNNNGVATVSSTGVVTAVGKGACTITATASGGQTASVIIVVREEIMAPKAYTTYNGHYYELYEDILSWKDAEAYCESMGGHLATITSQAENDVVQNLAKESIREQVYIGATDENTEGTWEWITGETFSYSNLGDGEPSATEYDVEDYLRLSSVTGKWQDIRSIPYSIDSCGFVCEYDEVENDDVLTKLPEGANHSDYEVITEYRSRNKQTTTSTASSMSGWTLYDSESTYGAWGSVLSTSTKPTESETLQITGTWTQYHYYHYCNYYYNGGNNWNVDSIPYGSQSIRHDTYLNQKLTATNFPDQGGKQAYGGTGATVTSACDYNFYIWFYAGETTYYNYQTRSKSTINYFYKWSNWSSWSTTPISPTDTKQVEKRTVYRLKDEVEKPVLTGWIKDDGGWKYYNADGTLATNKWLMDSVGWCFVGEDGYCVTNCWKADSHGWCYLDANGRMVCNNWVYDGGKWYFMDANGYMVSNQWRKDSKGWCYLGSSGAMLTNAWVKDSVGWCYVGADGYCVTNKWVKDSKGWCYLDSNGRMVYNKWVKDSVGWCYVGSSGYMVTNQWVQDGSNWYYIDQNGYMVTGTKTINGKIYKFASNGVWIA